MTFTATYSPDDNKLRLYASARLDEELYKRVKAAGFKWAPKQDLFVAPMWTPDREDLLIELAGEIEDEDKSLVERAEERADRFEDYSESRAEDADRARKGVSAIADGIPLGQPILVGHHSERHARKDQERIESGMRKAIKMWETSEYWTRRARGAISHAKYKERADVRQRRIKGIEADLRKAKKNIEKCQNFIKLWEVEPLTLERALSIANFDHCYWSWKHTYASGYEGPISLWDALQPDREEKNLLLITPEQAREKSIAVNRGCIAVNERWLAHYRHRLEYECAMLEDAGGTAADKFDIQVGGRVLRRGEWKVVTKLNLVDGKLNSVSVLGHFASTVGVDEIRDYKPPEPGDAEKVKAFMKPLPLCNYPGEGFRQITEAEYKKHQWSDVPKTHVIKATETAGAHRVRCKSGDKLWNLVSVYLTDKKRVDPPALSTEPKPTFERQREPQPVYKRPEPSPEAEKFDALKEQLKEGVKVVVANQLFPTPPAIAELMVDYATLWDGQTVLEPSAGTGNILRAIWRHTPECEITAVEINAELAGTLTSLVHHIKVGDFLQVNGEIGTFDRILMNPPFARAEDILHILHAIKMLKPGGRLVAICAAGPRQEEVLRPLASEWEKLPEDSFKEQGTGVNTVILTVNR